MRMELSEFLLLAAKGHATAIAVALDADPSLLNRQGYWDGEVTALHLAAKWGRADIVEHLLARGANPNPDSGGYDNWTPLQIGIHRDRARAVEILLAFGAELTIWAAAALGRPAVVEQLAGQANSLGPNAATPLHFASTVVPGSMRAISTVALRRRPWLLAVPGIGNAACS